MPYQVKKADVWAVDIPNRPGTLARVLEPLAQAGAQLEFLIARKVDDNTSRVFLAPIKGAKQKQAAQSVGVAPTRSLFSIRVEGPDRPGLGADLTRAIADAGVNLRGVSAAAIGKKTLTYVAVESEQAVKDAVSAARKALAKKSGR